MTMSKDKTPDRKGWLRWDKINPGHYVAENGKWEIVMESSRWHTYVKFEDATRFCRHEGVPAYRTLHEAQDHVDEFDFRGFP